MFDSLWVEKYRPKSLQDILLTEELGEYFNTLNEDSEISNLLFVGTPGIGKTSLARLITNSVLKCQYLYINASDENGIDTIRHKVVSFAQTRSVDGKIKVIILDEVDGLTQDAQRALRNTMEEYAGNTRFILTANYKYRVIEPIQSRCQSFDLTFTLDQCLDRINHILKVESVEVSDGDQGRIREMVRSAYPDMRQAINNLQKSCATGKLTIHEQKQFSEIIENIYTLCQSNHALKARKYMIQNEEAFSGDYPCLLRELFNYIETVDVDDNVKRTQMLVVSEYLYRSSHVLDQEINFFSCLLDLSKS